jgi:hypothetical protein
MAEVFPVVKVLGLDKISTVDFSFPTLNGYFIEGLPTVNAGNAENFYGGPDFSKNAEITVYALPENTITLRAPLASLLRFDNSFHYVSSGGAFRNAYIGSFKIPHSPVFPRGTGNIIMCWKTSKVNVLFANNIDVNRSHPLFSIQEVNPFCNSSGAYVEALRYDFESVKTRDFISYISLYTSNSSYPAFAKFQISNDGVSWTDVSAEISSTSTLSDLFAYCIVSNTAFRYLRVLLRSGASGVIGCVRVRKLLVFE